MSSVLIIMLLFAWEGAAQGGAWQKVYKKDGNWLEWMEWSSCTTTCGESHRRRLRKCGGQEFGGNQVCPGQGRSFDMKGCTTPVCRGGWSSWEDLRCDAECGGTMGGKPRHRKCDDPVPLEDHAPCQLMDGSEGLLENVTVPCRNDKPCGGWSSWVDSSCDAECGGTDGFMSRERKCDDPAPLSHQEPCELSDGSTGLVENITVPCRNDDVCQYGQWLTWTEDSGDCSGLCEGGSGTLSRTRVCEPDEASGRLCIKTDGEEGDSETDPNFPCINDNWCPPSWSSWVDGKFCDGQCGGNPGVRARYRKCNNPAPRGSQEHCQLVDGTKGLEEKELNIPCMNNDPCDALGDWTGWSEWLCNMCGSDDPGVETRARTCTGDAANCPGQGREKRDPCPTVAQQLAEGMKPSCLESYIYTGADQESEYDTKARATTYEECHFSCQHTLLCRYFVFDLLELRCYFMESTAHHGNVTMPRYIGGLKFSSCYIADRNRPGYGSEESQPDILSCHSSCIANPDCLSFVWASNKNYCYKFISNFTSTYSSAHKHVAHRICP